VRASRTIAHPPDRVFAFLADLRNHWRLDDAFIALDEIGARGGRILIRGPLGIAREARTRVLETVPSSLLRGRADVGPRTVGLVSWELGSANGKTHVTLSARVERASPRDRLLLALGGRAWLRRRFGRVLERLEQTLVELS
jgi:uncharacterized protein YndB with AHSA1/START domain